MRIPARAWGVVPVESMGALADLPIDWIASRILAFRPKVYKEGDLLVARSDWRSQLFCLGFAGRKVTVDPRQRVVRLELRWAWQSKGSRRIQFDWIDEVVYGYHELTPDVGARTETDLFTVALRLKNEEEVVLFRFYGQGDFVNEGIWPDWMYWDEFLTSPFLRASQESESLLYADLLSRMIGVPLGSPRP